MNGMTQVDPMKMARVGYGIIDRIQGEKPAVQIASATVVFYQMCQALGLNPREELERIERVIKDARELGFREVDAMVEYIKGELS